jgi:hypothetical protein
MQGSFESHVAVSAGMGINVINLHHSEWSGGHIALVHRFEMLAFGWDAQFDRVLNEQKQLERLTRGLTTASIATRSGPHPL